MITEFAKLAEDVEAIGLQNIYYKVIHVNGITKDLESCIVNDTDLVQIYTPGEWTYPRIPNTKLFVFDLYESAKEFAERENFHRNFELWECEIGEKDIIAHELIPFPSMESRVKEFWMMWDSIKSQHETNQKAFRRNEYLSYVVMTDKVKLTKKLDSFYREFYIPRERLLDGNHFCATS